MFESADMVRGYMTTLGWLLYLWYIWQYEDGISINKNYINKREFLLRFFNQKLITHRCHLNELCQEEHVTAKHILKKFSWTKYQKQYSEWSAKLKNVPNSIPVTCDIYKYLLWWVFLFATLTSWIKHCTRF